MKPSPPSPALFPSPATGARPWWLRKRVLFPLALLLGSLAAALIAYRNADTSTIVIYNETGGTLPPLLVRACGQTRTFPALADQESVCFSLSPGGGESAVHLELAGTAWQWDGQVIKPEGGYRVSIRLWPDHQVEAFTEISWLRRTLAGE